MRTVLICLLCSPIFACVNNLPNNQQDALDLKGEKSMTRDKNAMAELAIASPKADIRQHRQKIHGRELSDNYHWLKDQSYPEVDDADVLAYLKAENNYYKEFLRPNKSLIDTLFTEFKGRIDERETSVPYTYNGYEYHWYFDEGAEYRTRVRKNLSTGEEQVFLDENSLAQGQEYFVLGDWDISQNNRYLAYTVDTKGDERYQLRIRDLVKSEYLSDSLVDVQGGIAFAADNKSLFYALLEKDRWHAKEIKVHRMGTEQNDDHTVYTEDDDGFTIDFGLTSDEKYFLISSSQGEVSEYYMLPADKPLATPRLIVSREQGFSQSIDHAHDQFYILANDTHKNFRLARVDDAAPEYKNWQTIIAGSDESYLLTLQTFDDHLVLKSRDGGIDNLRIRDYNGNERQIEFDEPGRTLDFGANPNFESDYLRFHYESMVTPETVYDYDIKSQQLDARKRQIIPSGYDASLYTSERIMAPAKDGTLVPISLVYRKDMPRGANSPLHLYAYGAYGVTVTPRFSISRLSLMDRGVTYAIAHVRGSSMMGYQWYLDGKLDKRTNTFTDFIDCAKHLVNEGYVGKGNISISGASAGGELMGAAVVMAPHMWRSVFLGVPFVDVLSTMLDESLPLTPPEWMEWGNPITDVDAFDLIRSYSPYDNIEQRDYPPMMVTGGLNDPRVTYWEPAKWTAKMRAMKTDKNLLVMRMNMGAGHFANSGRWGRLKDTAEEYAFILLSHNISE